MAGLLCQSTAATGCSDRSCEGSRLRMIRDAVERQEELCARQAAPNGEMRARPKRTRGACLGYRAMVLRG